MTYPVSNQVYPVANAVAKTRVFITIFSLRNPTTADINYEPTQRWFNTANNDEWILVGFSTINEITTADWRPIAGASTTETLTGNSGGPVSPDGANNINVIGDLASGINVVGNPPTNTLTIFNVNGLPVVGFTVDAFTLPGTNPVIPDAMGLVTITGGQVAAGTTSNVIRTDSLAANTYTIEIQRSQAVASSTVGDNGVSHFDSANFSVDSNGFVSLLSQAFNYTNVVGPITYVVLSTDYYISCDPSGGAITLQFPDAPTFKRLWVIKDRTGSAALNNIILTTPGGTVTFDGLTSYIMNSNYQAVNLLANATPTYEVY